MNNVIAFNPSGGMREYNPEQIRLIKRTVADDCSPQEFDLFMEAAKRVGLDPFKKQIYAVVYNKNNEEKRKMSIITGIDGFRAVAERSQKYRPDENEPEIAYEDKLKGPSNPLGIKKAVVTVYKYGPDGQWYGVKGVAHWDEFAPLKERWEYSEEAGKKVPTGQFDLAFGNWHKMGRIMIAKCAEAQAIRRGWPEDLSGVYSQEEMAQSSMTDITASEAVEQADQQDREALLGPKDAVSIQWEGGAPLERVSLGELPDKCIEFIGNAESATGLQWWKNTNKVGLQEFWAKSKIDALEVKRVLEGKLTELENQDVE